MAKILLVEDDNNLREIYEARLAAEGYTIATAQDGEEALVVAKKEHPDLIISDVMMPRISGFEMLDILRNTDELKHTKIIMLTALGQSEDQARADNLGADKYLVKSQVTLEDIVNSAKELLSDTPGAPAPAAAATATPEAANPAPAPAAASAPTAPAATPAPTPEPVVAPAVSAPVQPTPATPAAPPATAPVVAEPAVATPAPAAPVAVPEPPATPAQPASPAPAPEPAAPAPTEPAVAPPTLTAPAPASAAPDTATAESSVETSAPQSLADEEKAIQEQIQSFADSTAPAAPAPAASQPAAVDSVQQQDDNVMAKAVEELTASVTPKTAPTPEPEPEPEPAPANIASTSDQVPIAHKKVIQPINSPDSRPDLNELLAKEQAKAIIDGTAPPVVDGQPATPATPQQPFDPNNIAL